MSALENVRKTLAGWAYSAGYLETEKASAADKVITIVRAEVIAERDAQIIAWLAKKAAEYGTSNRDARAKAEAVGRMADKLSRGAVRPTAEPSTPADLTVYRASHDAIVMGLYTTAAAAREHCETEERRSWPKGTTLAFDWIEDEEDGVAELVVVAGQNEESVTGYVVTVFTVASKYDEEADA